MNTSTLDFKTKMAILASGPGLELAALEQLALDGGEEALAHRVVVCIADGLWGSQK